MQAQVHAGAVPVLLDVRVVLEWAAEEDSET
jgi:hypothetical protein